MIIIDGHEYVDRNEYETETIRFVMNEKFFYDLQHIAMNGFFNSLTEF